MHPFLSQLAAAWPQEKWRDVTVLVGVSGGADSVALLRGLHSLRAESAQTGEGRLMAAHFNHKLRGAEADADEGFVRQLCDRLALPLEVGTAQNDLKTSGGDGLEAAAREARYTFFQQTAMRLGARYLVTAHTADDQVETMLHRLMRGTGIGGLAGIRQSREFAPGVALFRPLLEVRRQEVRAFLEFLGQDFREDSSNLDTSLTRNRIRHQLLPLLERDFAPEVRTALLRLGEQAADVHECLAWSARELANAHATSTTRRRAVTVDCLGLQNAPRHLLREMFVTLFKEQGWPLREMTFEKWDALADMVFAPPPEKSLSVEFPGPIRAEKKGWKLTLSSPLNIDTENSALRSG